MIDDTRAFLPLHRVKVVRNCWFQTVESALKRLDLLKYANKRVSSLSGGNKRKLCAALSVMAPVPVVLMDEPTRYTIKTAYCRGS